VTSKTLLDIDLELKASFVIDCAAKTSLVIDLELKTSFVIEFELKTSFVIDFAAAKWAFVRWSSKSIWLEKMSSQRLHSIMEFSSMKRLNSESERPSERSSGREMNS
jgi:hypothetical protein